MFGLIHLEKVLYAKSVESPFMKTVL
ncbi:unnamed protein product [Larinioides sclopetarius]|uniref:Ribosomal protein L16 n=1 Tax=Larinioides sclopetarius TaxID=280406 RepID=A0AAV2BJF1_9ARAC